MRLPTNIGRNHIVKPVVNRVQQHEFIRADSKQDRGCTSQRVSRLHNQKAGHRSQAELHSNLSSAIYQLCVTAFLSLQFLIYQPTCSAKWGRVINLRTLPWYLKKEGQTMPLRNHMGAKCTYCYRGIILFLLGFLSRRS